MNIYERYVKRDIRNSKKFKRSEEINIIALRSNSKDFVIDIIKKIDKKNNMNFKLNIQEYKYIEDVPIKDDIIYIIPIEAVFLSFLVYNYISKENYKYLIKKKFKNSYNIAYNVSEYYISKINNKKEYYFTREYADILSFIYKIISLKEKYVFGMKNFLEYFSKYYL